MPPELINILIQLPVVALFIWYFDRVYTRFEAFLREERTARDKILSEILIELRHMEEKLDVHDENMNQSIILMKERTAIRETPSRPKASR